MTGQTFSAALPGVVGRPESHFPDRLAISRDMVWDDLSAEERAELLRELRAVIAADLFPLSPRMRRLKAALAKLDPDSVPAPPPVSQPAPAAPYYKPSMLAQRKKARRRI